MSFYFENQQTFSTTSNFFRNQVLKSYKNTVFQFKKITKGVSIFKIAFFFLFILEVVSSIYLTLNFSKSSIIAIALGFIVLSIFTYFVLLFYFQAKKPQQINELRQRFIISCRQAISVPAGMAEHHLSVANALVKLSYYLYGIEYSYFSSFLNISFLKSFFEKLSCYFHQEDIFRMQELLLLCAIEEHIIQIKNTPTDLEVHVSLANAYVSLSRLYMDIKKKTYPRSFVKKYKKYATQKFEIASKSAIEEFIILKDFAPNDPWVHAQLAQCYHSLELYEDEAK